MEPIINPPNPYLGTLRVFPGTLVKVAVRPRPNATRFAVNLQTGPSLNPRDDIALHVSPCFSPPPRVVRNSIRNGNWELEEAWGNGSVISPHQPMEIMILTEPDQFKIAINGAHYCEFKHRMSYGDITHLSIDGDVDIERIAITSSNYNAPSYNQPTAAASAPPPQARNQAAPPYPMAPSMPMPSAYPVLSPTSSSSGAPPYPSGPTGPMPYPAAGGNAPYPQAPVGPMPTGAGYSTGFPQGNPYPQQPAPYPQAAQYPGAAPGGYPAQAPYGGPAPTGAGYAQGWPQQPHAQPPHQPGPSHGTTSTPFGNIPIGGKTLGTLAGLGLGAAAGAAVLSAASSPFKAVSKVMKPHKMFKHKSSKWGRSSSSSSNSSVGSFSSNSS